MTDAIALGATISGAVAAMFAAYATWAAPRSAAHLAESLRRDAERADQLQKRKMHIFMVLMQERARIYSENAVQALNLIDTVFSECRDVRETWSELFLAFYMDPLVPHVIDERLRRLLAAIARDLGIAENLRTDDLGRVYYPRASQQEQMIKDLQRNMLLQQLNAQAPSANAAPLWPPKP